MDFDELSRYRPKVEREIARSYDRLSKAAPRVFEPYVRQLEEFTLRGGKRFRALLVLAGYHLATGRPPAPALTAAAAMEHFQSWMLVHDDIIDHSEQRRGGPTLHRALASSTEALRVASDAERYGVGMGITLGDLEEPFTVEALLRGTIPASRRLAVLHEYVRMTRDTAFGQILDIRNGRRPVSEVSEEEVLLVHRLKSAVYTVACPLRIGAFLGGGRPGLLNDLESVGTDFGVAFQLRDDVLGAGFEATGSGKSANDLVEGKRTLLVIRAWQETDEAGRRALEAVLGRPESSPAEVERAREVIRQSGSLEYSEKRITGLAGRATRRVGRSPNLCPAGRALLGEIGAKLVHRTS